jgi:hypothetical protein
MTKNKKNIISLISFFLFLSILIKLNITEFDKVNFLGTHSKVTFFDNPKSKEIISTISKNK